MRPSKSTIESGPRSAGRSPGASRCSGTWPSPPATRPIVTLISRRGPRSAARGALSRAGAPCLSVPRPDLVVLAGMGGSAAGAELLAACSAERLDVPVVVHRGYGLPPTAGPRALVVASSYSGDTEETLSAVEAAVARRVPVVALSAGG